MQTESVIALNSSYWSQDAPEGMNQTTGQWKVGNITQLTETAPRAKITSCVVGPWWGYNNSWWYPVYHHTEITEKKVRLKLSEVERLKKAAKDDPKLREVLVKLTQVIEVEIDL